MDYLRNKLAKLKKGDRNKDDDFRPTGPSIMISAGHVKEEVHYLESRGDIDLSSLRFFADEDPTSLLHHSVVPKYNESGIVSSDDYDAGGVQSFVDIAVFEVPGKCSSKNCDLSKFGVGILSGMDEYSYLDLCKDGRLNLDPQRFNGHHIQLMVPSDGTSMQHRIQGRGKSRFSVPKERHYDVLLANCHPKGRTIHVMGQVVFNLLDTDGVAMNDLTAKSLGLLTGVALLVFGGLILVAVRVNLGTQADYEHQQYGLLSDTEGENEESQSPTTSSTTTTEATSHDGEGEDDDNDGVERRFRLWSDTSQQIPPIVAMGLSPGFLSLRRTGASIHRHRRSLSSLTFRSFDQYQVSSTTPVRRFQRAIVETNHILFSTKGSLVNTDSAGTDLNLNPDSEKDDILLEEDTIFALSSGFTGEQATAVAVIRISGPNATRVLEGLLKTSPSSKPRLPKYRQAALRKLYHPLDHSILDHALVLSFKGPNSFTGEDLVELQCHGSRVIVQRFLNEALPSLGCRLAEPGEFTQRAFSHGKLDLVQVEALADILAAETHLQVEQGLKHLDGDVSKTYEDWRSQLVSGLAHAEAVIDFGDDEHLLLGDDDEDEYGLTDEALQEQQESVWGEVGTRMMHLKQSMIDNLEDGRRGELIREGIKVAIVGPPNAGKSSLFNLLARRDAAIVSPIAGTTRDVLQVSMDLGGVKCTLQDTAGVRSDTTDVLELEGMKRAKTVIQEADLVVAMIDVTDASYGMDIVQSVLDDCYVNDEDASDVDDILDHQRMLLVRNKQDLLENDTKIRHSNEEDQTIQFGDNIYDISCQNQDGIDVFLDALKEKVVAKTRGNSDTMGGEGALITRARHRQHVEAAVEALERFSILSLEGNMAVDMAAEELRLAASELGRVTGAVDVEDVLDVLFSDFCIGK